MYTMNIYNCQPELGVSGGNERTGRPVLYPKSAETLYNLILSNTRGEWSEIPGVTRCGSSAAVPCDLAPGDEQSA